MKIKEMQKYYNYNNMYLLQTIRIFADDMIEDIKLINQYSKFNFKSSIEEIIKIKNKYIDLQEMLNIFSSDSVEDFLNDCEEFLKSNSFKDEEENELYQKVREKINILSDLK